VLDIGHGPGKRILKRPVYHFTSLRSKTNME
jgi:hypothetical protein